LKFSRKQVAAYLEKPDPKIRLVLFYGPDQGLTSTRSDNLIKAKIEDLNDPFLIGYLTGREIKKEPQRLRDEVAAQSLVGGERVVHIKLGNEDISKVLSECLETDNSSIIIIASGDLSSKSPVRKLVEKNKNAAAIPAYLDTSDGLDKLIATKIQEAGMTIDFKAKDYLINNLGSDRMISISELDKLLTYMGPQNEIKLNDVIAIIGDNGAFSIDKIIYPVANGDHQEVERNLSRALDEGQTAIAILRATIRHFQKLHLALGYMEEGKKPVDAIKNIKPPIMYLFNDQFLKQLQKWSIGKVNRALSLLSEAEIACKSTGLPANAICGRILMRLSQAVKK